MKREIRDKRYEYMMKSTALRTAKFDKKVKKGNEVTKLINKQEEIYINFLPFLQYHQCDTHQNDKMAYDLLHIPVQW